MALLERQATMSTAMNGAQPLKAKLCKLLRAASKFLFNSLHRVVQTGGDDIQFDHSAIGSLCEADSHLIKGPEADYPALFPLLRQPIHLLDARLSAAQSNPLDGRTGLKIVRSAANAYLHNLSVLRIHGKIA